MVIENSRPIKFPDHTTKDSPIVATFKLGEEEVTLRESHLRWITEIDGQSWLAGIGLLLRLRGARSVIKSIEGAKRGLAILRERGKSLDYGDELPNALADFEAEFGAKLNKLAEVEAEVEIAEYEARIEAEATEVGLTREEILETAQKVAEEKGYATYADFEPIIASKRQS